MTVLMSMYHVERCWTVGSYRKCFRVSDALQQLSTEPRVLPSFWLQNNAKGVVAKVEVGLGAIGVYAS